MNTKNLLKFAIVMLMGVSMVFMSCTKDDDPAPTPGPYVPTFTVTSAPDPTTIVFGVICQSDDFTYTKLIVTAPTSESFQYVGTGAIVTRGEVVAVPDVFNRLSGTWTFAVTGTISGGTNAGVGFNAIATVNVSAK